jgi:hypothetical protein
MNVLWTHFTAALRYVAKTETEIILQQRGPRQTIKRVHFQPRNPNEETWPAKLFQFFVITQDMAYVLTEETLDTLAKLLHSINVSLIHFPFDTGTRRERRDLTVYPVVPGDIGDQILDNRKCLHRPHSNRFVQRQRIHTCLARQSWAAVDLGRT